MTILLIVQEAYQIESLARGLRIMGYHVCEAKTLPEALEDVKHHGTPIDLILSDCATRILYQPELIQAVQERPPVSR